MRVIQIVLMTLIVESTLTVIIYYLWNENDDVLAFSGAGVIGWLIILVGRILRPLTKYFKYRFGKRSIFVEESTGNKYICKTKDCEDIRLWVSGYKLEKRYATKEQWVGIPEFSKEFINSSKRNCDNCKHYKNCICEFPYAYIRCEHDVYGTITKFDQFEEK